VQVQLSGTPLSAPKKRDDCPKAHALVSDYRFTAVLQAHQNLGGAANKESLQSIRKRWLRASTTIDDQTIRKMAGLDPKRNLRTEQSAADLMEALDSLGSAEKMAQAVTGGLGRMVPIDDAVCVTHGDCHGRRYGARVNDSRG
jgi:hypothetical protein